MAPKGWILEPTEIQQGFQNHHFNIKNVFSALKVLSRRGSEQNMKNGREMDRKMKGFGMRKSSPTLPCVCNSHLRRF